MTPVELLVRARAAIADPQHWTQHTRARNREGVICSPYSSSAVCFCASGALIHFSGGENYLFCQAQRLLKDSAHSRLGGYPGIAYFNDTHSHAEVLALFDWAIEDNQP